MNQNADAQSLCTDSSAIEYRITKDLPVPEVRQLYVEAGWIQPDSGTGFIQPMLENSFAVSAAFCHGRLIGLMRALSDGVSDAYLLDLVVDESFRRRGIAMEILKRLKKHLLEKGIDWIVCIGAPGTEAFYAKSSGEVMAQYTPMRFKQ